jgi:hypothetical protein
MNEIGLSLWRMNGKGRKLVFLKSSSVQRTLEKEKDLSQPSLVALVSLYRQALTPLILLTSTSHVRRNILRRPFTIYRPHRGSMTAASMMVSLILIIAQYIVFLGVTRQSAALKVSLVMDNHNTRSHSRMPRLRILLIWLLTQASHFIQPLGLTVFSGFKRTDINIKKIAMK